MKTLLPILIIILTSQITMAQENAVKKEVTIEDPVTKAKVKLKTGKEVVVRFKSPNIERTGIIMNLSDSTMILKINNEVQFVSFSNITSISLLAPPSKNYTVWVRLRSGQIFSGAVVRTMKDSLILLPRKSMPLPLAVSEIANIRIRDSKARTRGMLIGLGAGAVMGALIGVAVYTKPDCGHNGPWDPGCGDVGKEGYAFGGSLIGAGVGLAIGSIIGSTYQEFKIEGNQSQFDLFDNAFKSNFVKPNQDKGSH